MAVIPENRVEPFNDDRVCPKCGGADCTLKFCRGETGVQIRKALGCPVWYEAEHLHVTCARCRYKWTEYTKDKGE